MLPSDTECDLQPYGPMLYLTPAHLVNGGVNVRCHITEGARVSRGLPISACEDED
jgi:hypothetical protein